MSSRVVKIIAGLFLGVFLASGIFTAGLAIGASLPGLDRLDVPFLEAFQETDAPVGSISPTGEGDASASSPQTREELFEPFWEAWDIVHEQFVDPVDDVELMQGAIEGMLNALEDPHTSYMDPFEYEQASTALDGTYEGIGAWVDTNAEFLTIVSPMPNSPAEGAGLLPGDEIIAVDGEDMTGIDGNLVIRRVLGPAGTTVELTIRRANEPLPFTVEVTRESILIPTVESEVLEEEIGYIQLFMFGRNSLRDLRSALREVMSQDPRGLIIDLRGNGGGFLDLAVDVTSEFISNETILIERFGDGREEVYTASRGGRATEIPLVVLIDGGSASASEIVAGAIQDHERGLLVGEASFGKGSVQNWVPLDNDKGAVRITIARWFTPEGRQIAEIGLDPDVVVEITEEDLAAGLDPQLEEAVRLIREMVN